QSADAFKTNPEPVWFTAVAVHEGQSNWTALCVELDIAVMGVSSEDALIRLEAAVREASDLAAADGIESGRPVPDEALADLIKGHQQGGEPPLILHFTL
ncbi:MAG: hypothetical protein ACYC9D_13210, partial [Candidatus Dormibacteria bacterium]